MQNSVRPAVAIVLGLFLGVILAYCIAPNHALAYLAVGSAIAGGTFLGLFSEAFFARKAESEADRRQAQRPRRESPEFLQTVIDGIPDVTMVIDRDHRVVLANRAARQMARGDDLASGSVMCHRVSHHRDRPCEGPADLCPLRQVVETKRPATVTHTHYDADGNKVVVEVHATPVFDEAGQVVEMIEACREINDRRHADEVLIAG